MVKRDVLPLKKNTVELSKGLGAYTKRVEREYEEVMSVAKALMSLEDGVFIDINGAIRLQEEGDDAIKNAGRQMSHYIPLHPIPLQTSLYIANDPKSIILNEQARLAYAVQVDLTQFLYMMNGAYWVLLKSNSPQRYKLMKWEKKPRGIFRVSLTLQNGYVNSKRIKRRYLNFPRHEAVYLKEPINLDALTRGDAVYEELMSFGSSDLDADAVWIIEEQKIRSYDESGTWNIKQVDNFKDYNHNLDENSIINRNTLQYADETIDMRQRNYRRDRREIRKGFGFVKDDVYIKPMHYDKIPENTFRYGYDKSVVKSDVFRPEGFYHTVYSPARNCRFFEQILQFKQNYKTLNHSVL
jgi:hypothetical protein